MQRDNAGGGLRGLRAIPSPALLEAVCGAYGLGSVLGDVVDLGGASNLKLLVHNGDLRYVVRVYRPYLTEARLRNNELDRWQRAFM